MQSAGARRSLEVCYDERRGRDSSECRIGIVTRDDRKTPPHDPT